jgi:hypothetical protein
MVATEIVFQVEDPRSAAQHEPLIVPLEQRLRRRETALLPRGREKLISALSIAVGAVADEIPAFTLRKRPWWRSVSRLFLELASDSSLSYRHPVCLAVLDLGFKTSCLVSNHLYPRGHTDRWAVRPDELARIRAEVDAAK